MNLYIPEPEKYTQCTDYRIQGPFGASPVPKGSCKFNKPCDWVNRNKKSIYANDIVNAGLTN